MKRFGQTVWRGLAGLLVVLLVMNGAALPAAAGDDSLDQAVADLAETAVNMTAAAQALTTALAVHAAADGGDRALTEFVAKSTALQAQVAAGIAAAPTGSGEQMAAARAVLDAYRSAAEALLVARDGIDAAMAGLGESGRITSAIPELVAFAGEAIVGAAQEMGDGIETLIDAVDSGDEEAAALARLAARTAAASRALLAASRSLAAFVGGLPAGGGGGNTGTSGTTVPVPDPVLCNPSDPELTPIGDQGARVWRNDSEEGEFFSADRLYQNRNGQLFRLTASSRSEEVVRAYLNDIRVCLEAVPVVTDRAEDLFGGLSRAEGEALDLEAEIERALRAGADLYDTLLFTFNPDEENVVVEFEWLDDRETSSLPLSSAPLPVAEIAIPALRMEPMTAPPVAAVAPLRPDLTVSLDPSGGGGTAGQAIKATIVVGNEGAGRAPGTDDAGAEGYMVDVVLSTDLTVAAGFAAYSPNFQEDVLLRGGRISTTPSLEAEGSAFFDEELTIPADAPTGAYSLCAQVDPGGVVRESDESNNLDCVPFSIKGMSAPPTPSKPAAHVIYFVIDPGIDAFRWHGYRARCYQSASVQIRASAGGARVSFRRYQPFQWLGAAEASAADGGFSALLSASSYPEYRSYDVTVSGKQNGSHYTIFGGWIRGTGGGC